MPDGEAISFNEIPIDLRVPGVYVEIDASWAYRGLAIIPTRVLLIGPKLATGSAPAGVPVRLVSDKLDPSQFGRGSVLAAMAAALKRANKVTDAYAIAVDDLQAGVAATGSIAFGGAVTAAGTLSLMVAGRRLRVGVASGQATTAIASAVAAAIAADADLPVTAAVDGENASKVNVTCRHKGEVGNAIDLRHSYYSGEVLPAGLTVTVTALSGGTGNPDIQPALDALGDEWFTDIACAYADAANLAALTGWLHALFGPLDMRDGNAYVAAAGTHGTLTTLGHGLNSPHLSLVGAKRSPSPP